MSDLLQNTVASLREALNASAARIPAFEAGVAAAQERLRREIMKVEKLRELVALYEADESPRTATQLDLPDTANPQSRAVVGIPGRRPSVNINSETLALRSKKARMTKFVTDMLSLRGSVHRNELLKGLQETGIMGHEKDPIAHLAAFLSGERDRFGSDGKGNFHLRGITTVAANSELQPAAIVSAGDVGVGGTDAISAYP